ncbi:MAG: molybdopterin-dependent oxidoreductase [Desulfobacterales bacterium]|nr:molybdopterin-dependent oxidoreductase [Desulfobacterales bacterium]
MNPPKNNGAVKIEGQEGNAYNNGGGICLLGLSGLQLLYGPTRVQGPLKRIEENGSVRFQPISWREAIDEVVAKMGDLRSQGKPQSIACLSGRDVGTVPQLLKRLLNVYGSPNFVCMPSVDDAYASALQLTQGIEGFVGLDVEHTDFILSFGSALLDGYGSPPRMMQAVGRLKAQQGTLVQIDSRLSNTAAKADTWLALKPGTEAALALGMAHVIISQGRYNADFVNGYTDGFEAFAAMVKEKYAERFWPSRPSMRWWAVSTARAAFKPYRLTIISGGPPWSRTPSPRPGLPMSGWTTRAAKNIPMCARLPID